MSTKGNADLCVSTYENLPETELRSVFLALLECISIYDRRFLKITWAPKLFSAVKVVIYSQEAPYPIDICPGPQLAARGCRSQRER